MSNSLYLFVVWHRGMAELDMVLSAVRDRFVILKQFDVTWRPQDYVKNFSAFYGWKAFSMWWGKKRRSGTGVFRVIVVRDDHPDFSVLSDDARRREKDGPMPPDLIENGNVYAMKLDLRKRMSHTNVIHAANNEAEARHNLEALTGQTLEEFLKRDDLDGSVAALKFDSPIPYRPYKYVEIRGVGPQYLDGELRGNRVAIFLLPRCGVPTIFSFSFRILSLFNFAFCIGTVKMGFRSSYK